ncbi:hypothetical protein [Streptomyces sp. NPDC007905]|uniref:hypothetical protein n=1 Tax=Streptomyces sp. NPDC007905 TaxID=3364788 RepID=UPI0036F092E8
MPFATAARLHRRGDQPHGRQTGTGNHGTTVTSNDTPEWDRANYHDRPGALGGRDTSEAVKPSSSGCPVRSGEASPPVSISFEYKHTKKDTSGSVPRDTSRRAAPGT